MMTRIGVVGCGYWGINYVRVFSELPEATIVRVCDINEERLRLVHKKYPYVFPTRLLDELLNDEQVEAVVVSTQAGNHHEVVKACLLHGKHVLVEKPMTTIAADSEELVALAANRQKILMVGHTFLYNPAIVQIKNYLTQEDFGKIYYMEATRTHLGLLRKDVDAIWDLAPHDVSIFSYLLDAQPLWVSAIGRSYLNNGRSDVGFIIMGYPNNVLAHIHVSWINSNKVREISIVGSKKRIAFDDLNNMERIRIFDKGVAITGEADTFGEFQLQLRDGDILSPRVETSEPLKNQCSHFIDCIQTGKRPLTDGHSGLGVVKVMAAIDQSLARCGAPVEVAA